MPDRKSRDSRPGAGRYPLLSSVDLPADLRRLPEDRLPELADELRSFLLDSVSRTGGHLAAGLGVVDLTIALHYVFDTPEDRLVWDVGHQAYPHKILTGRRARMGGMRQKGGLSGFPKRGESPYDTFGVGHSRVPREPRDRLMPKGVRRGLHPGDLGDCRHKVGELDQPVSHSPFGYRSRLDSSGRILLRSLM